MKQWWPLLLLPALVFLTFHKGFQAEFLYWDDDALIQNNSMLMLPTLSAIKTAFTVYYHGDYFPFTLLSHWLDAQIWGQDDAQAMHTVNIFIHAFNTLLVFIFLKRVTNSHTISLITSLCFAIHPIQTETVMWISERKSVLSAFYTLISLNLYLSLKTNNGLKKFFIYLLSLLFFILAGLSKVTSILLPALLIIIDLFDSNLRKKDLLIRSLPFAIAAGLVVFLRINAYYQAIGMPAEQLFGAHRLTTVPVMAFSAIAFYVYKLFIPIHFSAIYPNFKNTPESIGIACVTVLILLLLSIKVIKRKEFSQIFFLAWFLLFLLPVLQIFPRINFVNDRYMYFPIIGLVGLLLTLVKKDFMLRFEKTLFSKFTLIIFAISLASTSFANSTIWTNNRNLWSNVLSYMPTNILALNNLGLAYQTSGDFDLAIEQFELILKYSHGDPSVLLAYNNLANIYLTDSYPKQNFTKAIEYLVRGIENIRKPRDGYELRYNLGLAYKRAGQIEASRNIFKNLQQDLSIETDYRFQWLLPLIKANLM